MTIINYKPRINFYVTPTDINPEHTFYGVGIKVKWESPAHLMHTPTGDYFPRQVRVEACDTIDGAFLELDTVLYTAGKYIDNLATANRYYRLVLIDINGAETEPTIPKNIHSPLTCRVWGRAVTPNGEAVRNVPIYFKVPRLPDANTSAGYMVLSRPSSVETNKDGYFEIDLLANIVIAVTCSDMELRDREFIVPADPSANLFDLL